MSQLRQISCTNI